MRINVKISPSARVYANYVPISKGASKATRKAVEKTNAYLDYRYVLLREKVYGGANDERPR